MNNNAIGGGFKNKSTTIIDGCYIDNGINDINTRTIRYHNYVGNDCAPKMIVKNTWVNGRMYFGYLGEQTIKGSIYVNNCSMASNIEISEQVEGASHNLNLFAYCNEIRS